MIHEYSVYFRCDADRFTGSGHVQRCLALAKALGTMGIRSHFIMRQTAEPWVRQLIPVDFTLHVLPEAAPFAQEAEGVIRLLPVGTPFLLVIDSYRIDQGYVQTIRQRGVKLMLIDDLGKLGVYDCDLLLNQNVYAAKLHYRTNPAAVRLFGPRFALLRDEFLCQRKAARRSYPEQAQSLLLTMGGSDPVNATGKLLGAIEQLDTSVKSKLEITVLLGAGHPNPHAIEKQLRRFPSATCVYQVKRVSAFMAKADVAITAGGTTVYELASLGCPSLILSVADNQKQVGSTMQEQQAGCYLGSNADLDLSTFTTVLNRLLASKEERRCLGVRAARLVDAKGALRVARHIREELSTR
ncbi:UNVERIFIED_CONTAM: UDP-2,4-diacetamido-2,4,6-trideoxy-beta-L-altropyranose hydrolase [Brevibacillus sp. OAP136]